MSKLFIVILALSITACATQQVKWQRKNMENEGFPPEYIDGYIDGCNSGQKEAGYRYSSFKRDLKRFRSDKLYSKGWNEGHERCKMKYESYTSTLENMGYGAE